MQNSIIKIFSYIILTILLKTIVFSRNINYLDFEIVVNEDPYPANMFIHTMGEDPRYLAILDSAANPIWFINAGPLGLDFKINQNKITFYDKPNQFWIVVNEFMVETDTLNCINGYKADYHDIILTTNGGYILQAYDSIYVNMSEIISGGHENAQITTLIIQEFDNNNNLIFEWDAWEHLNIASYTNLNLIVDKIVWMHGNSIEIDNDTNLIISNRRSSEIIKINRINGNVIWYMGGPNNDFSFQNDTLNGFSKQHDVRRIENGNILLFDNGNEHTPPISRAVEYSIDETNMIAELIWDYSHPEAYVGQSMGSSQRLPNNNTLINWGTINGEGAIITEVDFEKNIVFEIIYPSNTNCYKVRKEDWNFSTNLIPGDTNLDNKVNILDLFYIADFIESNNSAIEIFHLYRYDINRDREVNDIDLSLITQIIFSD